MKTLDLILDEVEQLPSKEKEKFIYLFNKRYNHSKDEKDLGNLWAEEVENRISSLNSNETDTIPAKQVFIDIFSKNYAAS